MFIEIESKNEIVKELGGAFFVDINLLDFS